MLIKETAKSAWRSLASNRLRTLLTMLGMIIGTAAVVAVLGIGEGARSSVESRIRSLGSNLITVRPGSASAGSATCSRPCHIPVPGRVRSSRGTTPPDHPAKEIPCPLPRSTVSALPSGPP